MTGLFLFIRKYPKYDIKPESFLNYLRYYGPHFNKKLCEFACKRWNILKKILMYCYNLTILKFKMHNTVYVANWCRNVFYGFSITDEKHFVLFIKDIFDKESDFIFNRWYADMTK